MVPSTCPPSLGCTGFPRTRGDGPPWAALRLLGVAVPPHPRGWSHLGRDLLVLFDGSPAPAGMVPLRPRARCPCPWFPRTRGDGPARAIFSNDDVRVPPHPRGWSDRRDSLSQSLRGSPAPAGMVPAARLRAARRSRFPRTRGDGPATIFLCWGISQVPPHPRGWSPTSARPAGRARGSPAPAGMVPIPAASPDRIARFPRTRGDGPHGCSGQRASGEVPPHPRGWSPTPSSAISSARGSPAPAGMVPILPQPEATETGFPRTRGDGPQADDSCAGKFWVPPHPRGWSLKGGRKAAPTLGSPAPAGMVPPGNRSASELRWFPRTRGDGPSTSGTPHRSRRVPPHPRGWSQARGHDPQGRSGSPAPAGMVPAVTVYRTKARRFPRTRGDGPSPNSRSPSRVKVPPHPRGWSEIYGAYRKPPAVPPHPRGWSLGSRLERVRLIGSPAPAGMVPYYGPYAPAVTWFPRTRGDGPGIFMHAPDGQEVPPHPRGWSPSAISLPSSPRGSPAPAGMVPSPTSCASSHRWFPRTRGDGPGPEIVEPVLEEVPPHPRGWSPDGRRVALRHLGSPAPAGMVPSHRRAARRTPGFPRTRGDGPATPPTETLPPPVPPHPRGWSPRPDGGGRSCGGSPAPAGMVPSVRCGPRRRRRFPRTRGDGP